ncbi:MAG TPA: site-2 protease family protein [Thermoanaerobaculia bacterium]|nr:site-2 protease family protein [Thermoanaerobaculia bacterium]
MRMFRGEIRLFRAFGVSVYLDYSWFIFFFLVVWTFGRFYFRIQDVAFSAAVAWVLGVAAAILLFGSVTFHELSHAMVSNRLGFPIRRITLFIFGGVAHMHSEPDDPKTEFEVAAAGPIASIILWVFFREIARVADVVGWVSGESLFAVVAQLNLVLALFNLVPGFPLDGGRLLRATVWWKTRNLKKATSWAAKGGELFGYILMFGGIATIFLDPARGWLTGVWYILIGIFVRNAAEQSYQHVMIEEILEGIRVSEIMGSNALVVHEGEPLARLVQDKFMLHKFTAYPVLSHDGKVIGIVELDDVSGVPRPERERTRVGDVMKRIPTARLTLSTARASTALKHMISLGLDHLPVVDESGNMVGIVTRSDIMNMFQIRSDLGDEVVV